MSQIIETQTIDTSYPVPGQDNDSQGFRENFAAIDAKFIQADSEITALETNAVLVNNAENDLQGTLIFNGQYNRLYGISYAPVSSAERTISLLNGALQSFTCSTDDAVYAFDNWPDPEQYAVVRVHFKSNGSLVHITLGTSGGGTIHYDADFPLVSTTPTLTLTANANPQVIEAWSFDNGDNVYVKYLGTFKTSF
jgi:hypothetical protein